MLASLFRPSLLWAPPPFAFPWSPFFLFHHQARTDLSPAETLLVNFIVTLRYMTVFLCTGALGVIVVALALNLTAIQVLRVVLGRLLAVYRRIRHGTWSPVTFKSGECFALVGCFWCFGERAGGE